MWYGSCIHPGQAQHTPTREVVKIPDVFETLHTAITNTLFLCTFITLMPVMKCLQGRVKCTQKSRGYQMPSLTKRLILNKREKLPFAAALIREESCIM